MAGRKPKNNPMTQTEMINTGKKKRAISRIYRAESDEIKDEAISASITNALAEIKRAEARQKVSLDDTAAVRAIAESYIESCAVSSCFPSMSSLAVALGCTRQALYSFMKRKPDSETGKFLVQLHDLFSQILAENSLRNNANAITSIFLLKSLFGYKETQSFEIVGKPAEDTLSVADIASRAGLLD